MCSSCVSVSLLCVFSVVVCRSLRKLLGLVGQEQAQTKKVGPVLLAGTGPTQCNATFPTLEEPADETVKTVFPACVI